MPILSIRQEVIVPDIPVNQPDTGMTFAGRCQGIEKFGRGGRDRDLLGSRYKDHGEGHPEVHEPPLPDG
jgi:hypothetical protein